MIKYYELIDGNLYPADRTQALVHCFITPDATENAILVNELNIDRHTISSALDQDEVSRIEYHNDYLLLIWKRPANYMGREMDFQFDVVSMGLLLFADRLVIITSADFPLEQMGNRHLHPLSTPMDVMLDVLLGTIHHYLGHLKVIKMIAREIQEHINTSMENVHLIHMFNLSESLIFYVNSINANGLVLERLKSYCNKHHYSSDARSFVDDLLIENNQCCKQAEIYSSVLSGLMDARASIVNNNMNVLLRNLTIVNVVFLPLNLIAGIGGMSEFSAATADIDWRWSYGLLTISLMVVGITMALLIRKFLFVKQVGASALPTRRRG